MSTPVESQVAQIMCIALQRKLSLDASQVFPAIAPDYDPIWKGDTIIEAIVGAASTDGGGEGAQDGGALLRKFSITLWVFYRCKLDQYSHSEMLLIEAGKGLLEIFEAIRGIFGLTCFPTTATPAGLDSDYLLYKPLKWASESETTWEDFDIKVARRSMTFNASYTVDVPTEPTLVFSDYANG